MSLAVKALSGVGVVGTVSAGGYLAYTQLSKKSTLRDRLVKDKFTILPLKAGKENSEGWSVVLEEYKKTEIPSTDKFSFTLDNSSDDANIEKLKEECIKVLDKESSDDSYVKVKRWCVVARNLSERLGDKGFRVLNNTENTNSDDNLWNEKESIYKDGDLDGITEDLKTAAGDKGKRREAIKKGCKTLLEGTSKTFSSDFDGKYSKAEKFCSVKK